MSRGKSGMIGVFRLESQMLPGNGKFDRTGLGSDRDPKEASNTAFNFLKANGNRISGSISTTTKDYIINYQDLQGIGMTKNLALPTLITLCSIALGKPAISFLCGFELAWKLTSELNHLERERSALTDEVERSAHFISETEGESQA